MNMHCMVLHYLKPAIQSGAHCFRSLDLHKLFKMRKLTYLLFLAGFLKKTDLIHITSDATSDKYL
jgi:hypothetical protein